LSRHRLPGWTLVGALVAGYLISHDAVQAIAGWAGEALTIERLSRLVTWGGALLALALAGLTYRRLRESPCRMQLTSYGVLTVVLIVLVYNTMFMVNTEAIHFPQYALLGMLLLPLTGRAAEAITWVTLFGAFDEAWQYWVLSNQVEYVYFDFNDIVLNLLGGAFGVLLALVVLGAGRDAGDYGWSDYLRSPACRVCGAFLATGAVLWLLGFLSVYPDPDAWIVLARSGPRPAFWATSYWGKTAHVLHPAEGLVVVCALLALYVPLDRRVSL
jgi:hypothetical protein